MMILTDKTHYSTIEKINQEALWKKGSLFFNDYGGVMQNQGLRFSISYVKSMRLYYGFVTGIAGWIGVSYYKFCEPDQFHVGRGILILIVLFLSWGVNQIVNDYMGLAEDRINAPNRPMVTGELNPSLAIGISFLLTVGMLGLSWQLNPWSIIPVILGVILNIVYEYAKAWSLVGNGVFGLAISMATAYGFLASGPLPEPLFTKNRIAAMILVIILNGLMTYYTYFKDVRGDRRAGKKTFIVRHGLRVARSTGIAGAFLPTAVYLFFLIAKWMPSSDILFMEHFVFCGVITIFLQLWTAVLYFKYPYGERTYFSLVTNIRACVAGQVAIIAIFNGTLALYLLCGSYVFIGFLFDLYRDARS